MASKILHAAKLKNTDAGDPNFVYEFNPQVAKHWFNSDLRLARFGVHGDGSCAYHSICASLNIQDYIHKTDEEQKQIAYRFRCSFSDKISPTKLKSLFKKNKNKSPINVQELQESLCDPKIWADETAIRLMSETLELNLIFLDMNNNKVFCGVHHESAMEEDVLPPTIVVCWITHSHFEPLARILKTGPRLTEIKMLFEPSVDKEDNELVRSLMKQYKKQCNIK